MIRARRPLVDHGVRRGDRKNPHQGDCTGTLCPACGCCMHCAEDGHCMGTDGCAAADCYCALVVAS